MRIVVHPSLPNAWLADGRSPNGVLAREPVDLFFPRNFPLAPPSIFLRNDFDRSLAHFNGGRPDWPPVPCIYDGPLIELLQAQGFLAVLNQLVVWLENAAMETLIDPKQGWEPVRRDTLDDVAVADAAYLRSLVTRDGGHAAFGFEYLRWSRSNGSTEFIGELNKTPAKPNPENIGDLFGEHLPRKGSKITFGRSVGLFVWPGKRPSGEPIIADRYTPETVTDIESLKARAEEYGCLESLQSALGWLHRCFGTYRGGKRFPLLIILAARRPFNLIKTSSPIELCPYIVEVSAPNLLADGDRTPVRPTAHRHAISVPMLRELSGDDDHSPSLPWIQVGAGSLGSKISIHLSRAGRAPTIVIDKANLLPHNAARHALLPGTDGIQLGWMGGKATALKSAIDGLGGKAEAIDDNVISILGEPAKAKHAFPRRHWATVNSTASLIVREAFASTEAQIPCVIETSLFADGHVGLATVEGPDRNPNTGDLITQAYALIAERADLRDLMWKRGSNLLRRNVGEGCGSATMAISDSRISMMAAPMAEQIAKMQTTGLPNGGGIIQWGVVGTDGLSVLWTSYVIYPTVVLTIDGSDWQVRISKKADEKMTAEVARWPAVETGGVMVGRVSEAARTFYIEDVLPAPEDSTRSAMEFVLGTKGLRKVLDSYVAGHSASLYCLGTWHSHLRTSGPSPLDRATARAIALAGPNPSFLLIHTPGGYRATMAETSLVVGAI